MKTTTIAIAGLVGLAAVTALVLYKVGPSVSPLVGATVRVPANAVTLSLIGPTAGLPSVPTLGTGVVRVNVSHVSNSGIADGFVVGFEGFDTILGEPPRSFVAQFATSAVLPST